MGLLKGVKLAIGLTITAVVLSPIIAGGILVFNALKTPIAEADLPKVTKDYGNTSEMFNQIIVDAFDNAAPDKGKKINFEITQDHLNYVLTSVTDQYLPEEAKQYITGVYSMIDGNDYTFLIAGGYNDKIKTQVCLKTKLAEGQVPVEGKTDETEDAFIFAIEDAKIGNVNFTSNLVKKIVYKILGSKEADLNKALADAGLGMTIDLKNFQITYPYSSLFNDAKKMLNISDSTDTGDNTTAMFFYLAEDLFNEGIIDIGFENSLSLSFDLDGLDCNETYVDKSHFDYKKPDVSAIKTTVEAVLDELYNDPTTGASTLNATAGKIVQYYLTKDESYLSEFDETSKGVITSKTVSTDTFGPASNYVNDSLAGITYEPTITSPTDTLPELTVEILEEDVNKDLSNTPVMGTTYAFVGRDDDSSYKVNFIALTNISMDITHLTDSDQINIFIGLNVNGTIAGLTLCTTAIPSAALNGTPVEAEDLNKLDTTITLKRNGIYLGDHQISEQLENEFYKLLGGAIGSLSDGGNGFIQMDANNNISLNMSIPPIDTSSFSILNTFGKKVMFAPTLSVVGDGVSANGKLCLSVVPSIVNL